MNNFFSCLRYFTMLSGGLLRPLLFSTHPSHHWSGDGLWRFSRQSTAATAVRWLAIHHLGRRFLYCWANFRHLYYHRGTISGPRQTLLVCFCCGVLRMLVFMPFATDPWCVYDHSAIARIGQKCA